MNTLNAAQGAAVASDAQTTLVIASPGAGKTRTLIERIVHLIEQGVPSIDIVAISYTRSAAAEIAERVNLAIGDEVCFGFIGTLHSFLLKLIQENYEAAGFSSSRITVLDEQAADDLLIRCAADCAYRGSLKSLKDATNDVLMHAVKGLVQKRFRQQCLSNNVISYDGILRAGLALLNTPLTLPFSHILVDEVQDLSNLDWEILEALEIPNRFYVGDPDQSIFGWRSANVENVLDLARDIEAVNAIPSFSECSPNAELFRLEENYRSDIAICEAAQRLIEHNPNRVAKTMRPVSAEDGEVKVVSFKSSGAEMIWAGASIKCRMDEGHSVAVLLRTNRLVDEWRDFLAGQNIPVVSRQRSQFPPDWPVVKAVLAVLNDPQNDWLCYNLIRLKDGEATANRMKLEANAAGTSINDFALHLPSEVTSNQPLNAWRGICARLNVSFEALACLDSMLKSASEQYGPITGTEMLALLAEEPEQTTGPGVFVGTIHSAKAKEWDCVFLPAFEQEVIPGRAQGAELEEARRLAYVGMTRARHRLFISFCSERKGYAWKPEPATPSQFIAEAGLSL